MAMSKRHFEKLAEILREATETADSYRDNGPDFQAYATARGDQIGAIKHAIVDMCCEENPRFDRERFLAACEPK